MEPSTALFRMAAAMPGLATVPVTLPLPVPVPVPLAQERLTQRGDEAQDVYELLLAHAVPDGSSGPAHATAQALAAAMAVACLGDNHLWQDLQLASRAELSALIAQHFPGLAERNHGQMRWKKFFYKLLCEREQVLICKAPSCAVCSDQALCFGPETP